MAEIRPHASGNRQLLGHKAACDLSNIHGRFWFADSTGHSLFGFGNYLGTLPSVTPYLSVVGFQSRHSAEKYAMQKGASTASIVI